MNGDQKLRVGIENWIGYAPLILAAELGYFDEQGIEIHNGGRKPDGHGMEPPDKHAEFAVDSLECIGTSINSFCAKSYCPDARIILALDQAVRPGVDFVVAQAPLNSMQDLRDARICYIPGSLNHFCMYQYFLQAGISWPSGSSLRPVEERNAMVHLLLNNEADAGVIDERYLRSFLDRDNFNYFCPDDLSIYIAVLVASGEALESQPKQVQALVNGYLQACAYLESNKQQACALLMRHFQINVNAPEASLRKLMVGHCFLGMQENIQLFADGALSLRTAFDSSVKVWRSIRDDVALRECSWDDRFLRIAQLDH